MQIIYSITATPYTACFWLLQLVIIFFFFFINYQEFQMGSLNHRSGFSIFFVPFFFFFWVKFQLFANVTTYDLIGSSFFILIYIVLRHFPSNGSGRQHKDNLSFFPFYLFTNLSFRWTRKSANHTNKLGVILPCNLQFIILKKKNTIVNIMFIYYNNPKQLS